MIPYPIHKTHPAISLVRYYSGCSHTPCMTLMISIYPPCEIPYPYLDFYIPIPAG